MDKKAKLLDRLQNLAIAVLSLSFLFLLLRGETTIALPSGIYLVRQGGTTIKVVL